MWQRSDYTALASYVLASVLLSIAALFLGMGVVRTLT
jgi:fluoride ion exporter CrcB/FEX